MVKSHLKCSEAVDHRSPPPPSFFLTGSSLQLNSVIIHQLHCPSPNMPKSHFIFLISPSPRVSLARSTRVLRSKEQGSGRSEQSPSSVCECIPNPKLKSRWVGRETNDVVSAKWGFINTFLGAIFFSCGRKNRTTGECWVSFQSINIKNVYFMFKFC